jgi:hypothetical protein
MFTILCNNIYFYYIFQWISLVSNSVVKHVFILHVYNNYLGNFRVLVINVGHPSGEI